jgi:hypothetical protein
MIIYYLTLITNEEMSENDLQVRSMDGYGQNFYLVWCDFGCLL